MRISIFIIYILIIAFLPKLDAQISNGGTPPSFNMKKIKSASRPDYKLQKIKNIDKLIAEDKQNPYPFRFSIVEELDINIKEKGNLSKDGKGNRIWQYHISSEQAYSLGLIFKEYYLPKGALLYVYSPDRTNILGAFTNLNNKQSGKLHLQELPGKEAIIEYVEPDNAEFEGKLTLGGIGQAYKNLFDDLPDDSFIGINCPIGDDWQLEKHGVLKYTSQQGQSIISCTGFLVNNTKEDGRPLMLTANHCVSSDLDAKNIVTFFNYEKEDCQDANTLTPKTISEATLLATNSEFDFSLVELSEKPPASYQPYYLGWSNETKEKAQGIGIHHPAGNEKNISIDYDSIRNNPFPVNTSSDNGGSINTIPANSTWYVYFDRGLSTGGSSGSPLFDKNKRVIGILSAGDRDDLKEAFYIRFDKAWNPFGSDSLIELKYWLDPANINPTAINGYIPFPGSTMPDAHFSANFRGTCPGSIIELSDKTVFGANSWKWDFSPDSVTFIEGTDTSRNPVVRINTPGEYSITLTSENETGSDIQIRNTYINTDGPILKARQTGSSSICAADYDEVKVVATGAEQYNWYIDESLEDFIELQNINTDTLTINLNFNNKPIYDPSVLPDSLLTFKVYVEGSIDSCSAIADYEIELLFHNNDDIENAYQLQIDSLQGPFSNFCATVEENEPIPIIDECTTQGEWCGCEYGNDYEYILANSTWFTFIGPESGVVGINTQGYDNQIAVYDADNSVDILSGDPSKYTIIGASDDYSETDYTAKIPSLSVTPGKKYWIQADGSACNATGYFSIKVSSDALISVDNNFSTSKKIVNIFPNPAKNIININQIENLSEIDISIFDSNGKMLIKEKIIDSYSQIDISSLDAGFYFIQAKSKEGIQVKKLIIEK